MPQIEPKAPPSRLLRRRDVTARTGLSSTTLWRLEGLGQFPKRRQLSERLVGWLESEIDEWISTRTGAVPAVKP
jgi:prophage regulatory protein